MNTQAGTPKLLEPGRFKGCCRFCHSRNNKPGGVCVKGGFAGWEVFVSLYLYLYLLLSLYLSMFFLYWSWSLWIPRWSLNRERLCWLRGGRVRSIASCFCSLRGRKIRMSRRAGGQKKDKDKTNKHTIKNIKQNKSEEHCKLILLAQREKNKKEQENRWTEVTLS